MINEKDRSQLLRMAGNIAGGLVVDGYIRDGVPEMAAELALATLKEVDRLIARENEGNV